MQSAPGTANPETFPRVMRSSGVLHRRSGDVKIFGSNSGTGSKVALFFAVCDNFPLLAVTIERLRQIIKLEAGAEQ